MKRDVWPRAIRSRSHGAFVAGSAKIASRWSPRASRAPRNSTRQTRSAASFDDSARNLVRDVNRAGGRESPATREQPSERGAVDVLHDHEEAALGHAEVDRRDYVGMLEACHGERLALKARNQFAIVGDVPVKQLDRNVTAKCELVGLVDGSHPALANALEELVAPCEHGADQRGALSCRQRRFARRASEVGPRVRIRNRSCDDRWAIGQPLGPVSSSRVAHPHSMLPDPAPLLNRQPPREPTR